MAEICVADLTFRYPGATDDTLEQLDLVIADGERHALLGGSGAGKTTLLQLLSGLLEPSGGQLLFDGEDLAHTPAAQRRVAQVFQFPVLYPAMTVLENLMFPLRNAGWKSAAAQTRARQVAAELEIDEMMTAKPRDLTLYQKQLSAIGRALVRPDLRLVLLDEPLTAVQPNVKWRLRRALKALQQESGVTMVYVTHDQTEALTFADTVSVMADGRILQTAPPTTIYAEPAHEYVGHFIGSPGMNFLDGNVQSGVLQVGGATLGSVRVEDGPVRVGFRPEWGRLVEEGAGLPCGVDALRLLGTRNGREHHLISAHCGNQLIRLEQAETSSAASILKLHKHLLFRDGQRVLIDG